MKEIASEEYGYFNVGSAEQKAVSWILEKTSRRGADIAIDCAGSSETLANCLNCVRPGGQVLAVGNPKGDMILEKESYWKILRNQIRLTGTWNSSFFHDKEDDWHITIEACAAKKLRLLELITHSFDFEELHRGLELAKDRFKYHNKIMVCNTKEDCLKKNGQEADI